MNEEEKKRLDELGGNILRTLGLISAERVDYATLKNFNYVGYGSYYMQKCWNASEMTNEADAVIYRQLIEIDSVHGTDASLQLLYCLSQTTRSDIIQVLIDNNL